MDPLFIKGLIACLPVITCLVAFVVLDVFKLMKPWEVLELMAGGAVAAGLAFLASGGVFDTFPMKITDYSQIGAPIVEETVKGLIVVLLFWRNRVGYLVDAAISGFAIGAGFSLIENLFYLRMFSDAGLGLWLVRGFGTAIMHGGATAILAATSQLLFVPSLKRPADKFWLNPLFFLPGLLAAMALHAAFNHFPKSPLIDMVVMAVLVPAVLLILFAAGDIFARRWLSQDEVAHEQLLALMQNGGFDETPQGQAIAELAQRLGDKGRDLKEYVRIHVELVARAEASLLALEAHEAATQRRLAGATARLAFDRLHALEEALGRATVRAVRKHLRFSRNDLWEMNELEEDTPQHPAAAAP
jgi:RsiW-degrading membrane proteinase PrsW (M82 family)